LTLTVVVGERPSEETIVKGEAEGEATGVEAQKWRGLTVTEITDENAQKYGVQKQPGVLILDVDVDSPAYEAGLRNGMIVQEIDKKIVRNMKDYNDAVQMTKGKTLVRTDRGYVIVNEKIE
jgi:serine protease Do